MTNQNAIAPQMVRVNQAVKLLGFSRTTLYRMVKSGDFSIIKRGSFSYVPMSQIENYLNPNEEQLVG